MNFSESQATFLTLKVLHFPAGGAPCNPVCVCLCAGSAGGADRALRAQHSRVHHATRRFAQDLSGRHHQAAAQPPEERQHCRRHGNTHPPQSDKRCRIDVLVSHRLLACRLRFRQLPVTRPRARLLARREAVAARSPRPQTVPTGVSPPGTPTPLSGFMETFAEVLH